MTTNNKLLPLYTESINYQGKGQQYINFFEYNTQHGVAMVMKEAFQQNVNKQADDGSVKCSVNLTVNYLSLARNQLWLHKAWQTLVSLQESHASSPS